MTSDFSDNTRIKKNLKEFFADQPRVLEWGIVPLNKPLPNAERLKEWVGLGMHAGLQYMQERLEERQSPTKLFPWAKSAVLFSIRQPVPFGTNTGDFHIAAYALGEDYHHVGRRILNNAKEYLTGFSEFKFEGFCDTWPVFERDLAAEAGLGWRGKNSTVIHRKHGSGFLLAGFFLDKELEPDHLPVQDFCGGCTACLDNCPTEAFLEPGRLDASKCLSYWTIEAKGEIPTSISDRSKGWIFGCDICQDVCPWNRKAKKLASAELDQNQLLGNLDSRGWLELLRKGGGFQSKFKNTPLLRAGRRALLRNVLIALRQSTPVNVDKLLELVEKEETDSVILNELGRTRDFLKNN